MSVKLRMRWSTIVNGVRRNAGEVFDCDDEELVAAMIADGAAEEIETAAASVLVVRP